MTINARKADLPQLTELYRQLHERHFLLRGDYCKMPSDEFFRSELEKKLDEENYRISVLEMSGSVTWCIFDKSTEECQPYRKCCIEQLAVDARLRRKGLGGVLLEHIPEAARRENCNSTELSVWCGNSEAVAFYNRPGFTPRTMNMELKLKQTARRLSHNDYCHGAAQMNMDKKRRRPVYRQALSTSKGKTLTCVRREEIAALPDANM